ncbi:MAG: hypothetical protein JSU66_13040 [Deltaproteobacteria bacterium]|nr:MAG: hypothetical protein JSU66_13040 [Deltaproteobacteria bacterium]
MAFDDFIERAHFQRTPDGRSVFYPWSLTGRGYTVPNDDAKQRLVRGLQAVYVGAIVTASIAFGIADAGRDGSSHSLHDFVRLLGFVVAPVLVCLAFYGVWVARSLEGLPPSDLRISYSELLAERSLDVEPAELRKGVLATFALLLAAGVCAWVEPEAQWILVVCLGLFIAIAALTTAVLRARREALRRDALSGGPRAGEPGRHP